MKNREISGLIDEYGFPYLRVNVIDPKTNFTMTDLKAIIDTGAAYTHIKPYIIEILNLEPFNETIIKHVTDGNIKSKIFKLNIKLNETYMIPEVNVSIITQPEYPCDIIIGIDILKYCNFAYNSTDKSFIFNLYPSVPDPVK